MKKPPRGVAVVLLPSPVDTLRIVEPVETAARLRPLLPVFGITRVANVTGLDVLGIPVVMVCRPNARSLSVSQGKGLEPLSAQVSGLMEAVECYHAEHILSGLKLASLNELRFTHELADVDALPRCSTQPFHPGLGLLWMEGRELLRGLPVWLPFELVQLNYTLPPLPGSGAFLSGSNGLASGNHLLEAISHGICEVVERDAATLWFLKSIEERQHCQVDLETVEHPGCRQVLESCASAGVEVAVWEITSDVGLPAFLCILLEAEDSLRPVGPGYGMGCHPSREVALSRALTEAAQVRLTAIVGSREDLRRRHYEAAWAQGWRSHARGWMGGRPRRDFRAVPDWRGTSLEAAVAWELERLRASGITQVIAVDLTRPEFRIPVVRVVIPGLEGSSHAAGYVPGARARRAMEARGA